MKITIDAGAGDQFKTVSFDTKYESPSEWLDNCPDGELVWDAYQAFEKEFATSNVPELGQWLAGDAVLDFLTENEYMDSFLEKWRNESEGWVDTWANKKWLKHEYELAGYEY